MYYNTIILKKGNASLTDNEYKNFTKGDTIFGNNSNPEELMRWDYSEENKIKANNELNKYRCLYNKNFDNYIIEEYALEYCNYYDDEFSDGSDYDLADE